MEGIKVKLFFSAITFDNEVINGDLTVTVDKKEDAIRYWLSIVGKQLEKNEEIMGIKKIMLLDTHVV
jgi:hypothetical protein